MTELLENPFDGGNILQNKRKIKKLLNEQNSNFVEKKVAILSGSTIGEFSDILELYLLKNKIKPIIFKGNYNNFYEDAVFNNKALSDFNPDIVYIHTSCKNILNFPDPGDLQSVVFEKINNEMHRYIEVWDVLLEKFNAVVIQNNFEMLPYRALGNIESYKHYGTLNYINLLNNIIYDYASGHTNFFVNDISYQSSYYGLGKWFDNAMWYTYKYPFAVEAIPYVAFNVSNIIKSLIGMNKRSMILDLDNTLWGGVIGDCGVENISLGNETPLGMAYSDFQRYIKRIQQAGINLSICSKNNLSVALEGFSHPGSVLSSEDFICKYINWDNKDVNIYNISRDLNTSCENMVFIDDNPVERDLVNNSIPDLNIIDIQNPEEYINILDKKGYFEITNFSKEDLNRNEYYKNDLKRMNERLKYTSYEEYLLSLEMECYILKINEKNIERVTQIINKTNQFNFTTKRYTLNEIQRYIDQENTISFAVRLADKYGDNGIVSAVLIKVEGQTANIELWVMSCRVFNRNLEYVVFFEICQLCKSRGLKYIEGEFIPTPKNKYIENLYCDLGFEIFKQNENSTLWRIDIQQISENAAFSMEIFRDE